MTGHTFAWDPHAIAVAPDGVARKLGRGATVCTACRVLEAFAAVFGRDDSGQLLPCPGPPPAVPAGAVLPGTGPLDPDQPPRWPASPPAGERKRHANERPR